MGTGGRHAPREVPKAVAPLPRPVIIGQAAETELIELLDHVHAQSRRNANLVAERIDRAVERIAANPEAQPIDPDIPVLSADAVARRTTVSGYTIRYLYPVVLEGQPSVLVVSIRRGNREALNDPEYLLRWLEERARHIPER